MSTSAGLQGWDPILEGRAGEAALASADQTDPAGEAALASADLPEPAEEAAQAPAGLAALAVSAREGPWPLPPTSGGGLWEGIDANELCTRTQAP